MAQLINYDRNGYDYQDYIDAANAGIAFGKKHGPKIRAAYNKVAEYMKPNPNSMYSKNNLSNMPRRKIRRVSGPMQIPSAGVIHRSRGLTIGKAKRMTARQRLISLTTPGMRFDSKWTFQMDGNSGRVSACQIPVLTRALLNPILVQMFSNALSDTTTANQQIASSITGTGTNTYRAMVTDYKSNLQFYNSSTNTTRCRLVWYKPKNNLQEEITTAGGSVPSGPLNQLMLASNVAQAVNAAPTPNYVVGDGITFDSSTMYSNFIADYDHAGWPITGINTTQSFSTTNMVADLDPRLVPGSPEVRMQHSRFWTTVSSEEFTLDPGRQHNTSLRLRNRIVRPYDPNESVKYIKGVSVVGILYIMGQIVFNDGTTNSTISTGSSQISCIRNDTCRMRPDTIKKSLRFNLTAPLQVIADVDQGNANPETRLLQTVYAEDV